MRTAVLADIHGNLPALEAVLAECDHESPDAIVVAGDLVGLPYEGDPAAFWMLVVDAEPELRRTAYDVPVAVERLRASGFPGLDALLDGSLIDPIDPDWVTARFEHRAGRGGAPGDPVRLS